MPELDDDPIYWRGRHDALMDLLLMALAGREDPLEAVLTASDDDDEDLPASPYIGGGQ